MMLGSDPFGAFPFGDGIPEETPPPVVFAVPRVIFTVGAESRTFNIGTETRVVNVQNGA